MIARSAPSSYAHEIAKKAWEDMRKSKRRPPEENSQLQPQRSPGNPRPSAAEAATALRLRMEEKKRLKESVSRLDAPSPLAHPESPSLPSRVPSSPHDKSSDFLSPTSKILISCSCQTGSDSYPDSEPWSADQYGTLNCNSESLKSPHRDNNKNHSSSSNCDTNDSCDPVPQKDARIGNENFKRKEEHSIFSHPGAASPRSSDRVRILADFTEGPGAASNSGVVERAGSQLCKRCSPRQIEAQIYGVKQSSAMKSFATSPRPNQPNFEEEVILLELRLSLNFSAIRDLSAFKKEVSENLARAAGIPSSKIRVEDVNSGRVGTVVLDVAMATDVVDNQGRNAQKIAANLRFQSQDEGSLLLQGKHTCQTICLNINGIRLSTTTRKDQIRSSDPDGLNVPSKNELSQQIINLLIQVEVGGVWSKGPQEEAMANLRDLIHDKELAERVAKDPWALSIISKPLTKGSDRSQTHCCACFRHLALEDSCCQYVVGAGLKVLDGLVSVLRNGSESARQKAAAALGNLAWKSEDCRKAICHTEGAMDGLVALLRSREGRSVESALAALSNLTLSPDFSVSVGASQQALQILMQELAGAEGLGAGTAKAEIRAAGIIRNLSLDPSNRRKLREFPGLMKALSKIGRESQSVEARERVEAALKNLTETSSELNQNRQEMVIDSGAEDAAIELLHDLLQLHGWTFVQDNIFKYDSSNYDRSTGDVLDSSHAAKCIFLHRYLRFSLEAEAKVVSLKRNGQVVARQEPSQATNEEIVFTSLPPSPDLDESVSISDEGGNDQTTYGETGSSDRNHAANQYQLTPSSISAPDHRHPPSFNGQVAKPVAASTSQNESGDSWSTFADANPELWRAMVTEGILDATTRDTFLFRGTLLALPTPEPDGLVIIRNKLSGETFYKGPGRHEVFPPTEFGPCSVQDQLALWVKSNGWHDLQRRLLDAGKTDYSQYAFYEKEMQPIGHPSLQTNVNNQAANPQNLFSFRGKVLRLVGESRMMPRRLIDEVSKEILWDFEASTAFKYPWARQALSISRAQDKIRVIDRQTGTLAVELTLSAPAGFSEQLARLHTNPQSAQDAQQAHRPPASLPTHIPSPAPASDKIPKRVVNTLQSVRSPQTDKASMDVAEDIVEPVRLLMNWTERKGWYELQRRLFDAGDTDFRAYAEIEPKMQATAASDIFSWEGRTLRLVGQRKKPIQLVDAVTGEMLWDFESRTRFHFPWARENFVIIPPKPTSEGAGRFQILAKKSGEVIVEYSGGKRGMDSLLLQAILMEAISIVDKRGLTTLQASTAADQRNQLFQVIREYDPTNGNFSPRSLSSQLRVRAGDILLVSQQGNQGWVFGQLVLEGPSGKTFGKEGWIPFTYVLPVMELAFWRGKLLRIIQSAGGSIVICDANSNEQIYNGGQTSPLVDWRVPVTDSVDSNGALPHNPLTVFQPQPTAHQAPPSAGLGNSASAGSIQAAAAPAGKEQVMSHLQQPSWSKDIEAGTQKTQTAISLPGSDSLSEAKKDVIAVSIESPASSQANVSFATVPKSANEVQPPTSTEASSSSTLQHTNDTLPNAKGRTRSAAAADDEIHPEAHDSAVWDSNVVDFESISASKFLLEGRFRCNAALGDGLSAEETLELHTSGEFEYVGGSAAEDGEKASLVALAGCYKVKPTANSKVAELLLLVEVAAIGTGDGDVGGNGHEVTGVCVRARLLRRKGKISSMEWISGHEEMGMGLCELPLAAEHVICDE